MLSNPVWGELPVLRDKVVLIEPFSGRDVPAMMSWNRESEAQRWFDWPAEMPPDTDHAEHCRDVIEHSRIEWAAGRRAPFVVRQVTGGDAVGSVELQQEDGVWSVSYLTRREWRGRGFATRAVRLVSNWAFQTLGIDKLHLQVAEDNRASRAVARKAGFVDSGRRTESEPIANFTPEVSVKRTLVEYVLERPRSIDT